MISSLVSDQITMARAKGVSAIPMSALIEIIYDQTGQLVSSASLVDLAQSLPFDIDVSDTEISIADNSSETSEDESDIEGPAIDAARKELK